MVGTKHDARHSGADDDEIANRSQWVHVDPSALPDHAIEAATRVAAKGEHPCAGHHDECRRRRTDDPSSGGVERPADRGPGEFARNRRDHLLVIAQKLLQQLGSDIHATTVRARCQRRANEHP